MARVSELLRTAQKADLPPLQGEVLTFLVAHPEEVFGYRDEELAQALPRVNASSLRWTLWALSEKGLIGKVRVGRRVYFGCSEAIKRLEAGAGTTRVAQEPGARKSARGVWRGANFTDAEIAEAKGALSPRA